MNGILSGALAGQEIVVYCDNGGKFAGTVSRLDEDLLVLEYETKLTYIAIEKITAVWPKSDEERPSAMLGFGH